MVFLLSTKEGKKTNKYQFEKGNIALKRSFLEWPHGAPVSYQCGSSGARSGDRTA